MIHGPHLIFAHEAHASESLCKHGVSLVEKLRELDARTIGKL